MEHTLADSLTMFRNVHKGQRGFIMACGPSINTVDLSLLEDEVVIGTSLAYKSGANLTYSFMGDKQIASQFWREIYPLPITWFVSKTIYDLYFYDRPDTYWFKGTFAKRFVIDLSNKKMYGGGTSTFLAMQFAYYLGLTDVYCIGLDHYKSYQDGIGSVKNVGKQNMDGQSLVEAKGEDTHHFTDDFYKEGTKYFLPSVHKMEASYRLARFAFENDGRNIYNLSPNTALGSDVIPIKNFEEVINEI